MYSPNLISDIREYGLNLPLLLGVRTRTNSLLVSHKRRQRSVPQSRERRRRRRGRGDFLRGMTYGPSPPPVLWRERGGRGFGTESFGQYTGWFNNALATIWPRLGDAFIWPLQHFHAILIRQFTLCLLYFHPSLSGLAVCCIRRYAQKKPSLSVGQKDLGERFVARREILFFCQAVRCVWGDDL